jgi:tetratricopeptide (TPR) repeat protein
LRDAKLPRGDAEVVLLALARELMNQGETDLAIRRYQEVLTTNPFNQAARQNAAVLLMRSERWQEAVAFFETQREIFGDKPGVMYGLGKSYLKLGNMNAAATALMLSKAAAGADEKLKADADKLALEALQRGGRPDLTKQASQPDFVTHAEFETKLNEMARFFAAEKRMSLWKSLGNGKHEWVQHPEARAQDTVSAFLSGSLGKRVEVLEAVAAGAGFVDLYVIGENGFRAIVELKMLGDPYSSTYAFAGENQIAQYMAQKGVAIGYLVIFDARKRDFGKHPESDAPKNKTIRVLLVDVRPDSPSKQH